MNNVILTEEERLVLLQLFEDSMSSASINPEELLDPLKSIYIKLGGQI